MTKPRMFIHVQILINVTEEMKGKKKCISLANYCDNCFLDISVHHVQFTFLMGRNYQNCRYTGRHTKFNNSTFTPNRLKLQIINIADKYK